MRDKLKGVLIAIAAVAVLAIGGAAVAGAGGGGDDGGEVDKAIRRLGPRARRALPRSITPAAAQVTETEVGDEESYYEVEVSQRRRQSDRRPARSPGSTWSATRPTAPTRTRAANDD